MSYNSLLIDNCTIQRYTEGVVDAYGNPTITWADHLVDEPCRLTASSGREIKVGAELVLADYKLFLGDIDVIEQDRITLDGVNYYEVLLVQNYQNGTADHHKQVWLRISR